MLLLYTNQEVFSHLLDTWMLFSEHLCFLLALLHELILNSWSLMLLEKLLFFLIPGITNVVWEIREGSNELIKQKSCSHPDILLSRKYMSERALGKLKII